MSGHELQHCYQLANGYWYGECQCRNSSSLFHDEAEVRGWHLQHAAIFDPPTETPAEPTGEGK